MVENALKIATVRHVQLTVDVNDDLEYWRELVRILASQTTPPPKVTTPHGLVLPMHRGP